MFAHKMYGIVATLALAGMLAVMPVASAIESQDSASIQSQCRREAQDYGVAPEQTEEYVSGCVQAYGGIPEAAPEPEAVPESETSPVDAGIGVPETSEQDTGAVIE
jgi:hypothetical protein